MRHFATYLCGLPLVKRRASIAHPCSRKALSASGFPPGALLYLACPDKSVRCSRRSECTRGSVRERCQPSCALRGARKRGWRASADRYGRSWRATYLRAAIGQHSKFAIRLDRSARSARSDIVRRISARVDAHWQGSTGCVECGRRGSNGGAAGSEKECEDDCSAERGHGVHS